MWFYYRVRRLRSWPMRPVTKQKCTKSSLEGVIEHYGVTSYAHQAEHESSEQPALWKSLSACDSEQQYCLTAIKLA